MSAATGNDAFGFISGRLTKALPDALAATTEGFTAAEWKSLDVRGKPLYLEHERTPQLGELTRNWVDDEGWCGIDAKVWKSRSDVKDVYEDIKTGRIGSLSAGFWSHDPKEGPIKFKRFVEASAVRHPQEKGALIKFVARNNNGGPTDGSVPSHMITMPLQIVGASEGSLKVDEVTAPKPVENKNPDQALAVNSPVGNSEQKSGATSTASSEAPLVQTTQPSQSSSGSNTTTTTTTLVVPPPPPSTPNTTMSDAAPSQPMSQSPAPSTTPSQSQQPQQTQGTQSNNTAQAQKQQQEQPKASGADLLFERLREVLTKPKDTTTTNAVPEKESALLSNEKPAAKSKEDAKSAEKSAADKAAEKKAKDNAKQPANKTVQKQQQQQQQQQASTQDEEMADDDEGADEAEDGQVEEEEKPTSKNAGKRTAEQKRIAALESQLKLIMDQRASEEQAKQKAVEEQKAKYVQKGLKDFELVEQANHELSFIPDENKDQSLQQLRVVFTNPDLAPLKTTIAALMAKAAEPTEANKKRAAEEDTIAQEEQQQKGKKKAAKDQKTSNPPGKKAGKQAPAQADSDNEIPEEAYPVEMRKGAVKKEAPRAPVKYERPAVQTHSSGFEDMFAGMPNSGGRNMIAVKHAATASYVAAYPGAKPHMESLTKKTETYDVNRFKALMDLQRKQRDVKNE